MLKVLLDHCSALPNIMNINVLYIVQIEELYSLQMRVATE